MAEPKTSGKGGSRKARDGSPKKAPQRRRTPRATASKKGARKVDKAAAQTPKGGGRKLTVAQRALRDTLMITRLAQGWGVAAIAAEADVDQDTVADRLQKIRKEYPLVLSIDPTKVVEDVLLGLQLSIGDFEALAMAAADKENYAAAVGAKKGADSARLEVIQLLQDIGRLPENLGNFRHLIDLREVAETMVRAVEAFSARITELGLPEESRADVLEAAGDVRNAFAEWMGGAPEPAVPEIAA